MIDAGALRICRPCCRPLYRVATSQVAISSIQLYSQDGLPGLSCGTRAGGFSYHPCSFGLGCVRPVTRPVQGVYRGGQTGSRRWIGPVRGPQRSELEREAIYRTRLYLYVRLFGDANKWCHLGTGEPHLENQEAAVKPGAGSLGLSESTSNSG